MSVSMALRMLPAKELAYSSIGSSYAAIGTSTSNTCQVAFIANKTDKDLWISLDGTNNHIHLSAYERFSLDVSSNKTINTDLYVPEDTFFYVKYDSAAPTEGSVYVFLVSSGS